MKKGANLIDPLLDSATTEDDGPVFTQYRRNAKGAIEALKKAGGGVAVAALYHPEIGDIDLRWGHTGDSDRAKGLGLAKLIKWHPEVLGDLQGFLLTLHVHQTHRKKGEIHLTDGKNGRAGIKVEWNNKTNHWLVTAYIKGSTSASKGTPASLDDAFEPTTATSNNAGTVILGFEMSEVNIFDSAVMSALERLKLIRELGDNRRQISGLGDGPLAAMKRLKLVKRSNEIRALLGMNAAVAKPSEPQATGTVQRVAAGTPADAESEGPIELTGKEFGDFPDTHEGRGELRKVVEENFRNILGRTFYSRALNAEVELRDSKQTPAKFFFKNFNPKKLKSVAAIGHLIKNGVKFKPSGKPYDKSDTNTKLYH